MGEVAIQIECRGDRLHGVLHPGRENETRGVLIIVGGPQYRVGSHRQFVLLARALAASGIAVLRFDYRGMGDSEGAPRNFENISDDIRAAVDFFLSQSPWLKEVVLWGLCDAASAAIFYAPTDVRITGVVLVNPWVHTAEIRARAYLRHYYVQRLFDINLWRKIWRGQFRFAEAFRSFAATLAVRFARRRTARGWDSGDGLSPSAAPVSLPDRMLREMRRYGGRVLVVLSGDDVTAAEFKDLTNGSRAWRALLEVPRVQRFELAEANHTFARRAWRDHVAKQTEIWMRSW